MNKLYHILKAEELYQFNIQDHYQPSSLKTKGFIHLAYERQLQKIITSFFKDSREVYLLEIEKDLVRNSIKD
ncbi:DUF952 domain-containing protein [Parashewanella tropica]|uniref:DUF952 domain-containing protein n=1 Tax=Parashewanella tropica TaxID=2547970 RepID=UPI00147870E7|nr:DUF952 domain-containing protein [Parashewanella tropica]